MTLRHLRIFVAVYREGSITQAARRLHLAQPGVSLAIRELEEAYQVRLFDRISRRLSVTEKGILFYQYADRILGLYDEMEKAMVSPDVPGRIHIGSSITIGGYLVPEAVSRFRRQNPACEIQVTIQNSKQIVQSVLKNELDLGLIEDRMQCGQLVQVPLMSDRLYFVCGKEHPLLASGKPTLEEISRYPFYLREKGSASREITDSLFKAYQLKCHIQWESVSNRALIQAVEKNPGITVLSSRTVQQEEREGRLVRLPVCPEAFLRSFTLIYHKKKYLSESLESLISLFADMAAQEE